MSKPATEAVPSEGSSRVVSILMVVVLPAPLGPRRPKIAPVGHVQGDVIGGNQVAEGAREPNVSIANDSPPGSRASPLFTVGELVMALSDAGMAKGPVASI